MLAVNKYLIRYGAARQTLAAFGATVRDEEELDRLTVELVNVVQETMQPKSVNLWLAEPQAPSPGKQA
jgi:hypothetical protein